MIYAGCILNISLIRRGRPLLTSNNSLILSNIQYRRITTDLIEQASNFFNDPGKAIDDTVRAITRGAPTEVPCVSGNCGQAQVVPQAVVSSQPDFIVNMSNSPSAHAAREAMKQQGIADNVIRLAQRHQRAEEVAIPIMEEANRQYSQLQAQAQLINVPLPDFSGAKIISAGSAGRYIIAHPSLLPSP